MKKLLFLLIFLMITGLSANYDPCRGFTMPSQQILKERLAKAAFDHYDEKTKISQTLANKDIHHPLALVNTISWANADYDIIVHNPVMTSLIKMRTPQLLETLLEENPQAIECLIKNNILKISENGILELS